MLEGERPLTLRSGLIGSRMPSLAQGQGYQKPLIARRENATLTH